MELISPSPRPRIPWQGTMLGIIQVITILFSILLFFMAILGITFAGLFGSLMIPNMGSIIPSLAIGVIALIFVLIVLPLFILKVFITIGIFSGKRWTLIAIIILAILGIMSNLSTFNFFFLFISGIELTLAIICLNDPFYNQNQVYNNPNYTPNYSNQTSKKQS